MSDLAHFQRDFAQALAQPVVQPSALQVYRNTSLIGAVQALADNYPVVRAIVGESMFENVAVDYALAQRPDSPVLALYGRRFADWIEAKGWTAPTPYLADVARIERLHLEALFAPDAIPLAPAALAEVGPDAWNLTRLNLHPATRFHWSPMPAMSIWLAHQCEAPGPIEPEWRPEGALFVRPRSTVDARLLDAPAHRFLNAIRRGETVGVAALLTAELYPHADLGGLFGSFIQAGVFAAQPPSCERTDR
jgi:hypothetical protein